MSDSKPSTLRTILWPSLITLAMTITRLVGELQGWITNESGGAGHLLGISWLIFVFGAWFGFRLSRNGSSPRLKPAAIWALVPALAIVGTFAYRMNGVDLKDTSTAAQEGIMTTLQIASMVAGGGALLALVIWTRLAFTLFAYGLFARAGVMVVTWLAKDQGWNTHYTKIGPTGIEKEMAETLALTSFAQFCLWVPFTVVFGTLMGCLFAARAKTKKG